MKHRKFIVMVAAASFSTMTAVARPRRMTLTKDELHEPVPCVEQDLKHVVDGTHHDNPR